jgi:hypothetical protein
VYFNAATQWAQGSIQCMQGFAHKLEMLQSGIGLLPKPWFHDVNAAKLAPLRGLGKGSVVLPSQVAFEPNQLVAHGFNRWRA